MDKSKICEWKIEKNIGIITLNNPPKNMLIDPEFIEFEKLKKWTDNELIKGLIIMGNNRHFSSGADIKFLLEQTKNYNKLKSSITKSDKILHYIEKLPIPTLACIKGACFGGGLEIALSCHIKIASENAIIGMPESEKGLMPGLNGTIRLPKLIGKSKSLELILSGDLINAHDAKDIGIIDYVIPKKNVFDFSLNLLKKMTKDREIDVIHSIVKSINNSKKLSFEEAMDEEMKMFCKLALKEANRNMDKN